MKEVCSHIFLPSNKKNIIIKMPIRLIGTVWSLRRKRITLFKNPHIFLSLVTHLTIWRNLATVNKTIFRKCLAAELYYCISWSLLWGNQRNYRSQLYPRTVTVPSTPRFTLLSQGHGQPWSHSPNWTKPTKGLSEGHHMGHEVSVKRSVHWILHARQCNYGHWINLLV